MNSVGQVDLRRKAVLGSGKGVTVFSGERRLVHIEPERCEWRFIGRVEPRRASNHQPSPAAVVPDKCQTLTVGGKHWFASIIDDKIGGLRQIYNPRLRTRRSFHPDVAESAGE